MKKKFLFINIISGLLFCASCKKFLTVTPQTMVTRNDLFTQESGFESALTGVYIQMNSSQTYGQNLSMTTIEQLVSQWDVANNTKEAKLGLYNYDDMDVDALQTGIFSQQYTTISSINSILEQIDKDKTIFKTPGLYELIKGECLGLRAYIHFDVLRLWGPVPSNYTNDLILPYLTNLSLKMNKFSTYTDFQNKVLEDLTKAENLLKPVDPILKYSLLDLGRPGSSASTFNPTDKYMAFRYLRMNYYAVKALEARAYLWFNNKEKAYAAAEELITATNPDGTTKFRLGTASDMVSFGDHILSAEHIFGLQNSNISTQYSSLFSNGTLKRGTNPQIVNAGLYGNSGTDIREVNLWQQIVLTNQSNVYVCEKYNLSKTSVSTYSESYRVPMLRISEMYFIAIETGPSSEAQALWDAFRTSRNLTVSNLPTDPNLLQNILLAEYRKEFVAEGQSFYTYKRFNAPTQMILWAPPNARVNYVMPLPKTELIN